MTNIVIPDSVTNIGAWAFSYCTSLTSIKIPENLQHIDEYAFYNCTNLIDVYYGGSEETWENIYIGDSNESLLNATIHFAKISYTKGDVDGNVGITSDDAIYCFTTYYLEILTIL